MYAQVRLCEAFRPFLVIGFAPRKVARAHCRPAARPRPCSALPKAAPVSLLGATWRYLSLAVHSLSLSRH